MPLTFGQYAFGEDVVDARLDVLNQPWRQIGMKLEMDKGDGALSVVPLSEISGDVSLRGSLSGFGVRELTFQRFGTNQTPLKNALLRGMRRVRLTGYRGIPGVMGSNVMFDGYLRDASFAGYPPQSATITCQDASLQYADAVVLYNVDPASLRSRTTVILDVLGQAGIPAGSLDAPNGTGIFFKPIAESGDRRVLDFLSEILKPFGATPYWRNSVFNFKRFDTSSNPSRTLQVGDFRTITIVPPSTNTPNTLQVSTSQMYSWLGTPGARTVTTSQSTYGTYAPAVAVAKQDHGTGAITPLSLSSPAVSQEITRVTTTTTYTNGAVTYQKVQTFGFYAQRMAQNRQNPITGATTFNILADAFQFGDGTWRSRQDEIFQLLSETEMTRTFDGSGHLTQEDTYVRHYGTHEVAIRTVNQNTSVETFLDVPLFADGRGWNAGSTGGAEEWVEERDIKTFTSGTDGRLKAAITAVYQDSFSAQPIVTPAFGGPAITLQVWGPASAKTYTDATGVVGTPQLGTSNVTYTAIDSTSHNERQTWIYAHPPTTWKPISITQTALTVGYSNTVSGPIPLLEVQNSSQPSPAQYTLTDSVRKALSNNIAIKSFQQNEYCETNSELATVAIEAMRALAAPVVNIEMDVDWSIAEGDVIGLIHPQYAYGLIKLLVTDIALSFTPATGRSSQQLTCRWYPPELAALA